MITYPKLGKVGRLGNHLFQIAATMGLALDHEESYGFPRWSHEKDFRLSGCFHEMVREGTLYQEPRFGYDPIPYSPGLSLEGFFQSEKYFKRHADEVRAALTPSGPPEEALPGVASLHVRRGDYLLLWEKHPVLSMDYYNEAMERLRYRGTEKFLVFSDDLAWCRMQPWASDVEVIPDMAVMDQFRLTINCTHHIMANSTFSWWTAWLNPKPEKIVIAPRNWFGETYREEFPTLDLFPPEWVIL